MKLSKLTAALCLSLAASPALAFDWGGFYAGSMATTDSGQYNDFAMLSPVWTGPPHALSGSTYGGFVGFLIDGGLFDMGLELASAPSGILTTAGGSTSSVAQIMDLKIRTGVEVGNALIYGVAGVSGATAQVFGNPANVYGTVYGTGVDYMLSPVTFVGIEYLNRSMLGIVTAPDGIQVDVQSVSVRVGYMF